MMMNFSFFKTSRGAVNRAAKTLLAGPGGLAEYPGPAALIDIDGRVIAANRRADSIVKVLGLGNGREPSMFVVEAVLTGQVATETVVVTPEAACKWAESGARIEITVLPVRPGETALVIGRNSSLEMALRDALVDSRRRYKELMEISSDFCWETDAAGKFTFVSPRGALGYSADELIGRRPAEFLAEPALTDGAHPFDAHDQLTEVDVWLRRRDGQVACLLATAMPVIGPDGGWRGARGMCRDVTDVRERDAVLARAQVRDRLLAYITRTVRDEIDPGKMLEIAATETAKALGAAACRIYRVTEDGELKPRAGWGKPARDDGREAHLVAQAGAARKPVVTQHDGMEMLCIATFYRGDGNGALFLLRDADAGGWSADERLLAADVAIQLGVAIAQIDAHERLEALSRTDGLTGLLNRRAFTGELEARLGRSGPQSAEGSLIYVDLDNFKPVNDILGHHKGDEALKALAGHLTGNSRPGDLVARLGGDEFALWLERTDEAAAIRRAERLLDDTRSLVEYSGDPARPLGISIGIAVHHPSRTETAEQLTLRADDAMYRVKRDGKNGYAVCDDTAVPRRTTARRALA